MITKKQLLNYLYFNRYEPIIEFMSHHLKDKKYEDKKKFLDYLMVENRIDNIRHELKTKSWEGSTKCYYLVLGHIQNEHGIKQEKSIDTTKSPRIMVGDW